ncbi:MAG: class I SAM-dependent methyltransferase [Myxococcota bacterium]
MTQVDLGAPSRPDRERRRSFAARTPLLGLLLLLAGVALGCPSTRGGAADGPNRDRHGPPDVSRYIRGLERPDRVRELDPEGVIRTLALPRDAVVADLGVGPGVFALPLARHLKEGLVHGVDWIFIVDTYHHLDDRVAYLRGLRRDLAPDGRIVILEYKPGELPVGPPASHKLSHEQRFGELRGAGFEQIQSFETHRYHDFEVWRSVGGGAADGG